MAGALCPIHSLALLRLRLRRYDSFFPNPVHCTTYLQVFSGNSPNHIPSHDHDRTSIHTIHTSRSSALNFCSISVIIEHSVINKKEVSMFTKIGTIGVGVSDQDKALDFYVNKLGFEKIDDQPMSETERWLEVAPPGAQTHLMLGLRGQSGGDKTGFTGYVLHTDKIEATCETLNARGVNVSKELSTEPWGK